MALAGPEDTAVSVNGCYFAWSLSDGTVDFRVVATTTGGSAFHLVRLSLPFLGWDLLESGSWSQVGRRCTF